MSDLLFMAPPKRVMPGWPLNFFLIIDESKNDLIQVISIPGINGIIIVSIITVTVALTITVVIFIATVIVIILQSFFQSWLLC